MLLVTPMTQLFTHTPNHSFGKNPVSGGITHLSDISVGVYIVNSSLLLRIKSPSFFLQNLNRLTNL